MIITVANLKGGIGKTTSVIYLAEVLADSGKSVCMIDMDPQANLSSFYGIEFEHMKKFNIMSSLESKKNLSRAIVPLHDNLAMIPSSINLADFEANFATEYGKELLLKRLLSPALPYDYIIIDTPPSLGIITRNALLCAECLVVPVDPHVWSIEAGLKLLANIDKINQSALAKENDIRKTYILPIRQKVLRSYERDLLKAIKENFAEYTTLPPISNSEDVRKSQAAKSLKKGKIYNEYKSVMAEIANG